MPLVLRFHRVFLAGWGFLGLGIGLVQAQIDARLESEQTTFLQYAPVPVTVRLRNMGAEKIHFRSSEHQSWLNFFVKTHRGISVPVQKPLIMENKEMDPGQSLAVEIDLAPYFLIRDPGNYFVQLSVQGPSGDPWLTEPLEVSVARGKTLWSREIGKGQERRKFSLIRFYENPGLGLYLSLDFPEQQKVVPAQRLGTYIPMSHLGGEFDKENFLHLLFAVGNGRHRIIVVNENGQLLREETRLEAPDAPRLKLNPDGQVVIEGGMVILPQNLRQRLSYLQSRGMSSAGQTAPPGQP